MDAPTTLLGLASVIAAVIVSDYVKSRTRKQTDETKIGELTRQSELLENLVAMASSEQRMSKKIWRRLKRVHRAVTEEKTHHKGKIE